ncbi:MAG: hypothetical protein ACRDD4_10250, partial [Culicoidibacterales bacterium]
MKIHEKLKHLSVEEIIELIDMYYNTSNSVPYIIEKFKIDCVPPKLCSYLPVTQTEVICRHCGDYLITVARARSHVDMKSKQTMKCPTCKHEEYDSKTNCTCAGCLDEKATAQIEARKKIQDVYGKVAERMPFESLTLQEQIMLVYCIKKNSTPDRKQLKPYFEEKTWVEYVNRLHEKKAISISPDTLFVAFQEDDFPYKYYIPYVKFNINVDISEETWDRIEAKTYFTECGKNEEILKMFKRIIHESLLIQFTNMMEKRKLKLDITFEDSEQFALLIDKISYHQILSLCRNVAKTYADDILLKRKTFQYVRENALRGVTLFYDRALKNDWKIWESEIEYIDSNLMFFLTDILGASKEIL